MGHRESSASNLTAYANNVMRLDAAGSAYCQTWYPYLDRNTGQLKARVSCLSALHGHCDVSDPWPLFLCQLETSFGTYNIVCACLGDSTIGL